MQHQNKELEEYLASIADGEYVIPQIQQELESRLESSPELRAALSLQTATKSLLTSRRNELHIEAPSSLRHSILHSISLEQEARSHAKQPQYSIVDTLKQTLDTALNMLTPKLAFPLGIAVGILGYFVYTDKSEVSIKPKSNSLALQVVHKGDNNFCRQAYANFHAIEHGDLQIQKLSSNESELKAFFAESGVNYPVFFPKIDASLVGGVVSDYKGTKFAHFIYKVGEKLIYAYEVPQNVISNHNLDVHPRAMEIANKADWYWEQEKGASNTMVLWKLKSNICTIVTNLRTEQLSALIHVEES